MKAKSYECVAWSGMTGFVAINLIGVVAYIFGHSALEISGDVLYDLKEYQLI